MPQFELKNNLLQVKINSFGAELCSVKSKENQLEYIWQADKTIWARYAPNLFPIVGKLKEGKYFYQGSEYQLPQHGFARDHEFTCVKQSHHQLVFELKSNSEFKKVYPFDFIFQIEYTLNDNVLDIAYHVSNSSSSEELLFSVGAHPAFNCPLSSTESFDDYELIFTDKNELVINALSDGLISSHTKQITLHENKLALSKDLFMNDALVFTNHQIDEVSLFSKKSKHGVKLTSVNWPYYGIWSKKDSEQFVCLEPWYGIADYENTNSDLSQKNGIIVLSPKQDFTCKFDITFF